MTFCNENTKIVYEWLSHEPVKTHLIETYKEYQAYNNTVDAPLELKHKLKYKTIKEYLFFECMFFVKQLANDQAKRLTHTNLTLLCFDHLLENALQEVNCEQIAQELFKGV